MGFANHSMQVSSLTSIRVGNGSESNAFVSSGLVGDSGSMAASLLVVSKTGG